MTDLYFKNKHELEQFLIDKNKLGSGIEGTCYQIDNYTLKIYNNILEKDITTMYNEPYYLQFRNINIENFNFIKNITYLEEPSKKIIGTISDYIKGIPLTYDMLYNMEIDKIINIIEKLLPSIVKLSKKYISVGDIYVGNIIYDNENFNFIDTSSYYYTEEYPYYIYKQNIVAITRELMRGIIGINKEVGIMTFLNKIDSSFNYYKDPELLLEPIKLLKELKSLLEQYCNKEIKCFKDCELILIKKLKYY